MCLKFECLKKEKQTKNKMTSIRVWKDSLNHGNKTQRNMEKGYRKWELDTDKKMHILNTVLYKKCLKKYKKLI